MIVIMFQTNKILKKNMQWTTEGKKKEVTRILLTQTVATPSMYDIRISHL